MSLGVSRLTDYAKDPLFEDSCEKHEDSESRSQHADLHAEKESFIRS